MIQTHSKFDSVFADHLQHLCAGDGRGRDPGQQLLETRAAAEERERKRRRKQVLRELAAEGRAQERQRKQHLKQEAEAAREDARVPDVVRSWLCGTRNGLIAKIERAHAQALAQDEREVQSVVYGLVKQLERDEAQSAQDSSKCVCGCGTRNGLIAQLERLHEQAEDVVHNLFYAKRSGLIARLERKARDAAEESFREAEVKRLLQRSGQAQGRDSLGVFSAPQSPSEGEEPSDYDGPTARFWWATLQCVKKAVLRRSHSLSSEKIGFVKKNRVVQVVAFAQVDDVHRVQLARADGQPGGWLSTRRSTATLRQIDDGKTTLHPSKRNGKQLQRNGLKRRKLNGRLVALTRRRATDLVFEQLQKRALRENIGVARLMRCRASWARIFALKAGDGYALEAEELSSCAIVSSYRGVWWSRNSHQWQVCVHWFRQYGALPQDGLSN